MFYSRSTYFLAVVGPSAVAWRSSLVAWSLWPLRAMRLKLQDELGTQLSDGERVSSRPGGSPRGLWASRADRALSACCDCCCGVLAGRVVASILARAATAAWTCAA